MDADIDSPDYETNHKENLQLWEKICKKKIAEAYDEYMLQKRCCKTQDEY